MKLKDSQQYQELLNTKLREFTGHVNELNNQLKEVTDDRNE